MMFIINPIIPQDIRRLNPESVLKNMRAISIYFCCCRGVIWEGSLSLLSGIYEALVFTDIITHCSHYLSAHWFKAYS